MVNGGRSELVAVVVDAFQQQVHGQVVDVFGRREAGGQVAVAPVYTNETHLRQLFGEPRHDTKRQVGLHGQPIHGV